MHTKLIQRHYDEVIAPYYDLDPQSVIGDSLDVAIAQILEWLPVGEELPPLKVLDLGMGTGRFLEKLRARTSREIQPFGLDLSERMIDIARDRIADLVAVVDDAANVAAHFPDESFDLIATHFMTGFVPLAVLAPKIAAKLAHGGRWSIVAGTKSGYPELQRKANSAYIRWLFGGKQLQVDALVCNPADRGEVVSTLEREGFAAQECETFAPEVQFANLDEFLEFAYRGGWLTPFIEALGLHRPSWPVRTFLNTCVFPMKDHHSIEIVLAQKARRPSPR
jgi:SAM-dependent methyltransferase